MGNTSKENDLDAIEFITVEMADAARKQQEIAGPLIEVEKFLSEKKGGSVDGADLDEEEAQHLIHLHEQNFSSRVKEMGDLSEDEGASIDENFLPRDYIPKDARVPMFAIRECVPFDDEKETMTPTNGGSSVADKSKGHLIVAPHAVSKTGRVRATATLMQKFILPQDNYNLRAEANLIHPTAPANVRGWWHASEAQFDIEMRIRNRTQRREWTRTWTLARLVNQNIFVFGQSMNTPVTSRHVIAAQGDKGDKLEVYVTAVGLANAPSGTAEFHQCSILPCIEIY